MIPHPLVNSFKSLELVTRVFRVPLEAPRALTLYLVFRASLNAASTSLALTDFDRSASA